MLQLENRFVCRPMVFLGLSSTFFLIFTGWLFHITKPSFLSLLTFQQKILVLASSLLLPGVLGVVTICIFAVMGSLSGKKNQKFWRILSIVSIALILASSFLLLIDNFTITIFDYGIRSSKGLVKPFYGLLLLTLLIAFCRSVDRWEKRTAGSISKRTVGILIGTFLTAAILGRILSYIEEEKISP